MKHLLQLVYNATQQVILHLKNYQIIKKFKHF